MRCDQTKPQPTPLTLNAEAAIRLRWDHKKELLNKDRQSICSLCSKPIADDDVPLRLWANDGVDMATVGPCCMKDLFHA